MIALALHAAWTLTGPGALFLAAAFVGSGLLALFLPAGCLSGAADPADPWAPLTMALVAGPAYQGPLGVMTQLASVLQHGNSIGAGFALLALGAGLNLGVLGWIGWRFGVKRALVVVGLLFAVVLLLAYGLDRPLRPSGARYGGHSHAFDEFCAPAHGAAHAWGQLTARIAPHEVGGLLLLGGLILVGLASRRREEAIEAWLARAPASRGRLDQAIPGPVLGGISLAGIVVASFFGCLAYFPGSELAMDELENLNTESAGAALAGDREAAERWIPLYREGLRRFRVGAMIRGERLSDFERAKTEVLDHKLEALAHVMEADDSAGARRLSMEVDRAFRRLRRALRAR